MDLHALLEIDAPLVLAFDRSARRVDVDGRLHVTDCRISKSSVNPYMGSEIVNGAALGLKRSEMYRLYRDRAALKAAAPTFENVPLLIEHQAVSANDPKKSIVVGTVSNVRYLHPYLVADLAVWDAEAIQLIESGHQRELSCGYHYRAVMGPGTVDGMEYDGRMADIVGNHVALVAEGRAGPEVMVNDSAMIRETPMHVAFPQWNRLRR